MRHPPCCWAVVWLATALLATVTPGTAAATARRVWDADYNVASTPFPSGDQQILTGVDMQRMLLYPANTLAFVPAAYDLLSIPNNARLQLTNCTIFTTFDIFNSYFTYSQNISDTAVVLITNLLASFIVKRFTAQLTASVTASQQVTLTVVVDNLTLIYDTSVRTHFAPMAHVNSSASLRAAIGTMALIGSDGAVSVQGRVSTSTEAGWPVSGYAWTQADSDVSPSLLINGPSSSSAPVSTLDLYMLSNVVNIQAQADADAVVTLRDLNITNMCMENMTLTPAYFAPMSILMAAFGGNIQVVVNNSNLAVPLGEVYTLRFWSIISSSPFPEVRSLAAGLPFNLTVDPDAIGLIGTSLRVASLTTSRGVFSNVTYDGLPRTASQLLQPTFCFMNSDGTPGLGTVAPRVPQVIITVGASLDAALRSIAASGDIVDSVVWPLVVIAQPGNANFTGTTTYGLNQNVLWMGSGALTDGASRPKPSLNLRNLTGVVSLLGSSTLYMQSLTLTELTEAPVPQADGVRATTGSALLLSAFEFPRSSNQLVMLDVHLIVPANSFAPLYALAMIGGIENLAMARQAYGNWTAAQHPVLDGITRFNVTRFDESGIILANYEGWGYSATNLMVAPATNFSSNYTLQWPFPWIMPPPPPTAPPDDTSTSKVIAVVVGVVVGVASTMIIGLLVWFFCRCRRRRQYQTQKMVDIEQTAYTTVQMQPVDGAEAFKRDEKSQTLADSPTTTIDNDAPQDQSEQLVPVQVPAEALAQVAVWDPRKEVEQLVGVVQGQQNETLHLLEPIGTGGFGTVYRGRWRNLDVAVKTVLFQNKQKDTVMGGPERRAIMEAAACSSVVHRNVVATYHYDIKMVSTVTKEGELQIKEADQASDWKLFLVQELCDVSLADAIEASVFHDKVTHSPKLPLVFAVLQDISAGMAYIHSKNIIHADLKPENVLLKHNGDSQFGVVAKITDFGLCSTIDPTKSHVSGFNNGTPFYVAPEISLTGRAEKQSDVFSFGVLLVEVYRGVPPWVRTANGFRHNKDFLNFSPGTPQLFLQLVKRCLDRKPKNRPRFSEICDTLQEICMLMSAPTTAPGPSQSAGMPVSSTPVPAPGPAATTPSAPPLPAPLPAALVPGDAVTLEALVSVRGTRHLASQNNHLVNQEPDDEDNCEGGVVPRHSGDGEQEDERITAESILGLDAHQEQ